MYLKCVCGVSTRKFPAAAIVVDIFSLNDELTRMEEHGVKTCMINIWKDISCRKARSYDTQSSAASIFRMYTKAQFRI